EQALVAGEVLPDADAGRPRRLRGGRRGHEEPEAQLGQVRREQVRTPRALQEARGRDQQEGLQEIVEATIRATGWERAFKIALVCFCAWFAGAAGLSAQQDKILLK